MLLNTHSWGTPTPDRVICIHGIGVHGGIFHELGERLAELGRSVLAVDLRGHGGSEREPPWRVDTHVSDVLETLDAEGVEKVTWIGHSFGGLVAAALAARSPQRTAQVVLLDPGLSVPPDRALRSAEIERLDWSFATVDGAVNAMLSSDTIVAAPAEIVAAFVKDDVKRGPDERYRFSYCPSAVVTAWSEMTLPPPPVARVPTLLLGAETSLFDGSSQRRRYEEELGELLTTAVVPNGHNVLWESPEETIAAVVRHLEAGPPT